MDRTPEEEAEVQAMQDEILKPPPSAWSDEPPRENGYWWFRASDEHLPFIKRIFGGGPFMVEWGNEELQASRIGGQWQPVAEPLA